MCCIDLGNTKMKKWLSFRKHSPGGADIGGQRNVIKDARCCDGMCIVQTIKEERVSFNWCDRGKQDFIDEVTLWA